VEEIEDGTVASEIGRKLKILNLTEFWNLNLNISKYDR
jgi:hypothetical protein